MRGPPLLERLAWVTSLCVIYLFSLKIKKKKKGILKAVSFKLVQEKKQKTKAKKQKEKEKKKTRS